MWHVARRARGAAWAALTLLVAVPAPVPGQLVPPPARRWEVTVSTGVTMAGNARGSLERSLDAAGFGDERPCVAGAPVRCSASQVFSYPRSPQQWRASWSASAGFRLRRTLLVAVQYSSGNLVKVDGFDLASGYELRTSGEASTVALVPQFIVRDAFRIGAGPALTNFTLTSAAQLPNLLGAPSTEQTTERRPGLLLHASAATRSSEALGIEVAVQHLLAGSADAGPFLLSPTSSAATLSFAPAAVPLRYTSARIAIIVRPR